MPTKKLSILVVLSLTMGFFIYYGIREIHRYRNNHPAGPYEKYQDLVVNENGEQAVRAKKLPRRTEVMAPLPEAETPPKSQTPAP